MAFDDLPPQSLRTPENTRHPEAAISYGATALARSRDAAQTCRTVLDVAYGEDVYQKLDIYLPEVRSGATVPVLMFFHGGAFAHGYKEWNGFMAPAFVDLPAIFISVSYRLVPDDKFPAAVEDAFSALKWVYENIKEHGGDPDRISVSGWSAGGNLASMIALRYQLYGALNLPTDVVKACHAASTAFRINRDAPAPGTSGITYTEFYLGEPENDGVASPINFVDGKAPPFFVSHGGEDFAHVISTSADMVTALEMAGAKVQFQSFDGLDHYEFNLSHGDPASDWVKTVRGWMTDPPQGARISGHHDLS
jgi:acetyl esterase/lipase